MESLTIEVVNRTAGSRFGNIIDIFAKQIDKFDQVPSMAS